MESDSEKKQTVSWYSELELRNFIDMAVRFGIDSIYNSRTTKNPYSIFRSHVLSARENYKNFDNQFHKRLRNSANTDEIGKDLNGKFLTGINIYIDWYDRNKKQLEKFKPNCPYTEMLSVIEMTKREIVERFPQLSKESEVIDRRKTLMTLITHEKAIAIVDLIKGQYRNIKGKRLKLLLIALQELNLLPHERIAKSFHDCCLEEFDWDIASYNAMNGYIFNDSSQNTDSEVVAKMKIDLKTIL